MTAGMPASSAGSTDLDVPVSASIWHQIAGDALGRYGSRVGLFWIAILLFAAVFAPLLANSMPLIAKVDDAWSFPMLHNLTPTDVTLFVLAAAGLWALFKRRMTVIRRGVWVAGITVVTAILAWGFVRPPVTVDWQHYRDLDREGHIQFKLMAPFPYSPNDYQRDDPDAPLQPPSHSHWLGTEQNGGDVLSRMIHASRIALAIGLISTGIAVAIGIVIGGMMGFFVGRVDIIGMRLIEIFEAIPTLFLLITFVAFFGRDLYMMMAIIGFTSWTGSARFIRAEFLRLREQDFVHAAVAAGLPLRSILFRHLLPNGVSPLLVTSSFGVASAILFESTLSFLGIGPINEPSWGQLLEQSRSLGGSFVWWLALFPGIAIFFTVFSYNLLGEALRDALDPKLRR